MSCDGNQQGGCNYWLKLPRDITVTILQQAGALHMLTSAQFVCTQWRDICTDPSSWTTIRVVDWKSYNTPQLKNLTSDEYRQHVKNMIRRAVDRSSGSLFDLDLDELMSKELLLYVVERCTNMRRLRIWCFVERVALKFPLLEDLEFVSRLSSKAIKTLGRYCPRLRSLKIHVHGDEEVKAIARSMPQLRHICFSRKNLVTDIGLQALLDGCPHLESLDIRQCYISKITEALRMMKKKPLPPIQLRDMLEDPSTWSTIRVRNCRICRWMSFDEQKKFVHNTIRRAVDKSRGGLVDLDLGRFITYGDILCYVVERCTQIRRLHGYMTLSCSEEALRAAATRLPLLEDLKLDYYVTLSTETIETFGRCCPRLTSYIF